MSSLDQHQATDFPHAARSTRTTGLGRTLWLGLRCARVELKDFLREPTAVVFGLVFPVLLLVLFASIFDELIPRTGGVTVSQYMVPGVIAIAIMTSGFSSLAIIIATERDVGTIKRLAATPLPVASYFLGKVMLVVITTVASIATLLVVGVAMFDLSFPADGSRWLTFAWVTPLGIAACSLMGIAYARLARNARVAPAIVTPPFLVLQFISGTFIDFEPLPAPLKVIASAFPLRWMALGMRSVFLPDSFLRAESEASWQHGTTFVVLAAWVVGGAVLTRLTFRWRETVQ